MEKKIIKTDDYLLVVDESEIKVGDWYYVPRTNKAYKCEYDPTELELEKRFGVRKTIAHLPLNGSPILEGVDLLPPLGDEVEKMAFEKFSNENPTTFATRAIWIDGYNQAKEKYKYTEEDLLRLLCWADSDERNVQGQKFEDFIQSLSQPKMPIGFECVTKNKIVLVVETEPITTTTPEGRTQWVGTYIYE